jgi:nucleoside-diphosphate-sugar epimerase
MNIERIIVTGGSEFIGTNLIEFMSNAGCNVLNLDITPPLNRKHNCYWRKCDILDSDAVLSAFREFSPTHVVHLASRTDIMETKSIDGYAVNTVGTENVLRAIQGTAGVQRAIITSSMLVCRLGYVPSSDTDYAPPNLYGKSKVLTETITRNFGLNTVWTIIRPTTIWGPWSNRYRDEFFAVLRKGLYFHPCSRKILKTYGYVGNVVHQINGILHAPKEQIHGRTLYVSDPPIDLYEWVDGFSQRLRGSTVRKAPMPLMRFLALCGDLAGKLGIRFPMSSFRLNNMTIDNVLDISQTIAITGPGPFSLDAGIELTINWLNAAQRENIS